MADVASGDSPVRLPYEDAGDLLDRQLPLQRYDLYGLFAPGCITAVGGYTGAGKSPLIARMLKAMLAGDPDFAEIGHGKPLPEDYMIVWLTQESEYTFQPLLRSAGLTAEIAAGRLKEVYLHAALGAGLTWPEIVEDAMKLIGPRGLIIVDTLPEWAMVKTEDDNAIMAAAMRPVVHAVGGG
jgi:hypothetical protein